MTLYSLVQVHWLLSHEDHVCAVAMILKKMQVSNFYKMNKLDICYTTCMANSYLIQHN